MFYNHDPCEVFQTIRYEKEKQDKHQAGKSVIQVSFKSHYHNKNTLPFMVNCGPNNYNANAQNTQKLSPSLLRYVNIYKVFLPHKVDNN